MILRYCLFAALIVTAAACAPRGVPSFVDPVESATIEELYAVVQRSAEDGEFGFGADRTDEKIYRSIYVSIPPVHERGQIEWPRSAQPDPAKHFGITATQRFDEKADFFAKLRRIPGDSVMIQVHGYNTNPTEALYRLAQIRHDYDIEIPTIAFIWPSAAELRGYVYDTDSALFARDALLELIRDINRFTGKKAAIAGHSLGTFLVMETLRQNDLQTGPRIADRVSGVFLLAPDLDPDLFEAQLSVLDPVPQPFLVLAAEADPALKVSTILRGTETRVGQITNEARWAEFGVDVVNLTEFSRTASNPHSIAATSAVAIAFLVEFFSTVF
ncbi:MAG: alpha/beta hydrolase [Pseudomonadota bacterium]